MRTFRNVIVVVIGVLVGGVANIALVTIGSATIPLPEGVDPRNLESLTANAHLLGPQHFIFPLIAHAIGTLIGALIVAVAAGSLHTKLAFLVGGLFMLGGIFNAITIPAPFWFIGLDLVFAYIPMAYLGIRLAPLFKAPDE